MLINPLFDLLVKFVVEVVYTYFEVAVCSANFDLSTWMLAHAPCTEYIN